jgi:hypothetical protein
VEQSVSVRPKLTDAVVRVEVLPPPIVHECLYAR